MARGLDRVHIASRDDLRPHAQMPGRSRRLALALRAAGRAVERRLPVLAIDVPAHRPEKTLERGIVLRGVCVRAVPRATRRAKEGDLALQERIEAPLVRVELRTNDRRARAPEERVVLRVVADAMAEAHEIAEHRDEVRAAREHAGAGTGVRRDAGDPRADHEERRRHALAVQVLGERARS